MVLDGDDSEVKDNYLGTELNGANADIMMLVVDDERKRLSTPMQTRNLI